MITTVVNLGGRQGGHEVTGRNQVPRRRGSRERAKGKDENEDAEEDNGQVAAILGGEVEVVAQEGRERDVGAGRSLWMARGGRWSGLVLGHWGRGIYPVLKAIDEWLRIRAVDLSHAGIVHDRWHDGLLLVSRGRLGDMLFLFLPSRFQFPFHVFVDPGRNLDVHPFHLPPRSTPRSGPHEPVRCIQLEIPPSVPRAAPKPSVPDPSATIIAYVRVVVIVVVIFPVGTHHLSLFVRIEVEMSAFEDSRTLELQRLQQSLFQQVVVFSWVGDQNPPLQHRVRGFFLQELPVFENISR